MNTRNAKGQFVKKSATPAKRQPAETPPRWRRRGGKAKAFRISGVTALICIGGIIIACMGLADPWETAGIITAIASGLASLVALALAFTACPHCGALMPDSNDFIIDRTTGQATGYRNEVEKHYDKKGEYTGESRRSVPYTYTAEYVKKRTDYHCKDCNRKWSTIGSWTEV